jgi:hypothetical protein
MAETSKQETILLFGRDFTEEDLWIVKEIVRRYPRLSREELVHTICENLQWFAPNGNDKVESCRQLLRRLESQGELKLPPKQSKGGSKERRIALTSQTDASGEIISELSQVGVQVQPVREPSLMRLWNEYVERYHILGYKRPFGAHQRYFILSRAERPLGCVLFSASAWALLCRDQWIGWSKTDRSKRLHLVVNNSRFLIFPWVHVKNLASRALSLTAKRICHDWQDRYGYSPVLLETFVDAEKYHGTCYKAANWIHLGQTAGRGRMDRHHSRQLTAKHIYVYPLCRDFRTILCAKRGDIQ